MILYDHAGKEVSLSHPDDFAIPHVYTFGSIVAGGWETYFHEHYDEAMRHRRENGLAMYRDLYLQSLLRERVNGTLRLKWHIDSDNPRDPTEKAVTDGLGKIIRNIRHLRWLRTWTLRGPLWFGRYAAQVRWGWETMKIPVPQYSGPAESGMKPNIGMERRQVLTIKDMFPINGDKVNYQWNGTPYILAGAAAAFASRYNYRMIVTTGGQAILLDNPQLRRQFIIGKYDPDDSDYYEPEMGGGRFGVGIRSRIYWMNWMRLEYLSWVSDTLERIGLGVVVIEYDMSNAEAKKIALETAKKYNRRSAIVMPVSMDKVKASGGIRIVEAPTGGAQFVMQLAERIESQEERFIVGQSMSSGADNESGLGGTGRSLFAADTKQDIIAGDAEDHAETLTGGSIDDDPGLVNMVHRWTYPELWQEFGTRFRYNVDDVNPLMKLQAVIAGAQLGVTYSEDEVRELIGMRAPEEGEPVIGMQQQPGGQPGQGQPGQGAPPGGMPGGQPPGGMPGGQPPGMGQPQKGEPNLEALLKGLGGRNGEPAEGRMAG